MRLALRHRGALKAVTVFLFMTGVLFSLPPSAPAPPAPPASGAEVPFRKEFIENYRAMRHDYLSSLVRKNKFIIPGEVKALVEEASKGDKTFNERMELLDLASAMASMHRHWNGDERPLKLVDEAQREEIRREEERRKEEGKWERYERYRGNILMLSHEKEVSGAGKRPVIFPHWVHRLYYGCSACHDAVFKMMRGGEDITHSRMEGGRLCGACHDGKTAFGAGSGCERCHAAGDKAGERLMDSTGVDLKRVRETAGRIGAGFNADILKGALPHDRFSFIDWAALGKTGAYEPLKGDRPGGLRDNAILIKPSMEGIDSVVFSHRSHSEEILCSSCHPAVFSASLRGNKMDMTAMSEGRFCGYCHGRVAFGFAECNRCHSLKEGEDPPCPS